MFWVWSLIAVFAVVAISICYPLAVSLLMPAVDVQRKYRVDGRERTKVFVSGGSSGIGKELVLRLLRQKCVVVSVSLERMACKDDEEKAFVELCRTDGSLVEEIANFACREDTLRVIGWLERAHSDVSVAFLNAGFGYAEQFGEMDAQFALDSIETNVVAHVLLAQHFVRAFKELPGGRKGLVVTSSSMGHLPVSNSELYCASKSFLERFALSLAPKLRSDCDTDVLVVLPGAVRSAFFSKIPEVSVLKPVKLLAQDCASCVDVMLRCLGRPFVVAVDSGLFAYMASIADRWLSPNLLCECYRLFVWCGKRWFGDYINVSKKQS